MARNWTANELATLESNVSTLQATKAADIPGWEASASRAKAVRSLENLTGPGATDNLMSTALSERHKNIVGKLRELI